MNKAYEKQYRTEEVEENGVTWVYTYTDDVLNPITKEKPYLHKERSARGKSKRQYHIVSNHLTGEYIGKLKLYGNNRANTSKRPNVHSRHY